MQQRAAPLNYHERTCTVLPPEDNLLQFYPEDAEKFADENEIKLTQEKQKSVLLTSLVNFIFRLN